MIIRSLLITLSAFAITIMVSLNAFAQNEPQNQRKITLTERFAETDPDILQKIDQWQDLKFGFFMHWGIYAQKGLVESWSICNEDWIDRKGVPYEYYKQWYWNLSKEFNPKQFNPDKWAKIAKNAGMKYVVFTSKHHDGFCMYDTKYTDYKITNKHVSPFAREDGRDVLAEVLKSFRNEGFWTGVYFSKADWHDTNYWSPLWATPDRNVNYSIDKYPERWQKFSNFTYNQIKELTHNYGKLDILWLDGGWIRPSWSVIPNSEEEKWLGAYKRIQDIDMPKIAAMAREKNKNLIIVDRSVGGQFENYRTPEQQVSAEPLDYPWETCMTMGDAWGYVPNDNYKSTNTLIHLLCEIVCKGGNFLLNVGPDEKGNLPDAAVARMDSIGEWMRINSKAIYSTRPIAPYQSENICFTKSKNGNVYAIILISDTVKLQSSYDIPKIDGLKKGKKTILGSKQKAELKISNTTMQITLPKKFIKNNKESNAIVIEL